MARVWTEVTTSDADLDLPEVGEDVVAKYGQRLDHIIDTVLVRAPSLATAADGVKWCFTHSPSDSYQAMACWLNVEQMPAIVVQQKTVDECSDDGLIFVVGHELSHIRLGHTWGGGGGRQLKRVTNITDRVWTRATEIMANDHLIEAGISMEHRPSHNVICGEEAFGFSVAGYSRRQIWECLVGEMSVEEFRYLPRDYEVHPEQQWEPSGISAEAEEFWAHRTGPWQDSWTREHDRLCMNVRRQRRDALVATI